MWKNLKSFGYGATTGLVLGILGYTVSSWKFWFALIALHIAWALFPLQSRD